MLRLGVIALLAVLGVVSAVMAIGGLPWGAGPAAVVQEPAPQGGEAARALTDQAVAQLRRASPAAAPADDMQAVTRSVVAQLQRVQGTPLERAVRQAMQADTGDIRVDRLLQEAPRLRPAPRPDPVQARLEDLVRRMQQTAP
jgi:hypothetical protein